MSDSYTLYIHEPETDDDIDDDLYEPAAFQVPMDMEWSDLQDMICKEIGTDKMSFSYIDDEKERVRIDSQEEYQIALDIRKFEGGKDLHIYATRNVPQPHRRQKRREKREKENREDHAPAEVKIKEDDEVEIFRPPVEVQEQESNAEEPALEQAEASNAPPAYEEEAQEDTVTSTVPDINEETIPMTVMGNPLINIIKKEVKEAVQRELDEVWEYVNLFKKDVNEKLDTIGEHLVSETRVKENMQQVAEREDEAEKNQKESCACAKTEEKPLEEDTNNFAASFICESLLDGSAVHTGASFQKFWVFRNEGVTTWDEDTKLHLLEETCTPAGGNDPSEWGAKKRSVEVPLLRHGESGVVCAEHTAPAHLCNYNSSWRLSHNNNAFGPRVWCNVRVVDDLDSPFASPRGYDSARNLGSFEVVGDRQKEGETDKENQPQNDAEELHGSLVPPEKVKVEITGPHRDDAHNDHNIMSFNMADISEATKYIENEGDEAELYNPAVTTVEQEKKESLHSSIYESEKQETSIAAEEQEEGTQAESLVMIQASEAELEGADQEEPRTLEGPEFTPQGGEDARPEAEREAPRGEEEDETHVENFTEPAMQTPDHGSTSDEEEEEQEESSQEEEPQEGDRVRHESSEDLHSVDFNLDDDAMSMASYVSDFVVVPLPECFDVNRPLNVSEEELAKEKQQVPESERIRVEEVPVPEVVMEDPTENYPPSDSESSDEEPDSQPSSTTHVKEYKSEDSIPIAPKSLGTPTSPITPSPITTSPHESLTQRGNLAANFVPPIDNSTFEGMERVPPSLTNESLNCAITQNFQAFTTSPASPPPEPPKPKVPMNQMRGAIPKIPLYVPTPGSIPNSVLDQNEPYNFNSSGEVPYFPPFEQGWRRNPIPVPASVVNEAPWVPPHPTTQLPKSEFTLNRNSNGIESTLPSHPFAATMSRESSLNHPPPARAMARQRSVSPPVELPDDFYPPGLEAAPGMNLIQPDLEPEEEFRTPPPSPPPAPGFEPSALDHLYEMGFHDMDLNRDMFDRCGRDINRTVQALVYRMQADEQNVSAD